MMCNGYIAKEGRRDDGSFGDSAEPLRLQGAKSALLVPVLTRADSQHLAFAGLVCVHAAGEYARGFALSGRPGQSSRPAAPARRAWLIRLSIFRERT